MRLSLYTLTLLACFVVFVAAWSKEDQEIFRLRDEVEASEGTGVSFYDFLGVETSATHDEITKAFRKRSKALHPDKAKQKFIADRAAKKGNKKGVNVNKAPTQSEIKAAVQAASDRYARLGVVQEILKGEGRERYDHFLRNGFPAWKGTGYYYSRYRPGLGTVLFGLFIFIGGAGHYLALWMSWKRQQEFISRYIKFAREAAWGNSFSVPGLDASAAAPPPAPAAAATGADDEPQMPMNRRQRRMQEKDARKDKGKKASAVSSARDSPVATPPAGSTGFKKRVVAENGKVLAVDSVGNVYLEQRDEEGETQEFLLDPNEIPRPTISDTALVRFPKFLFNTALNKIKGTSAGDETEEEEELDIQVEPTVENDAEDYEVLEREQTTAQNGREAAAKARKGKRGRRGV